MNLKYAKTTVDKKTSFEKLNQTPSNT